MINKSLVLFFV